MRRCLAQLAAKAGADASQARACREMIEAGESQPADRHFLEAMAGFERPQQPPRKFRAGIDGGLHQLVAEPAVTGLADTRGTEVIAGRRRSVLRQQRPVHAGVDALADRW